MKGMKGIGALVILGLLFVAIFLLGMIKIPASIGNPDLVKIQRSYEPVIDASTEEGCQKTAYEHIGLRVDMGEHGSAVLSPESKATVTVTYDPWGCQHCGKTSSAYGPATLSSVYENGRWFFKGNIQGWSDQMRCRWDYHIVFDEAIPTTSTTTTIPVVSVGAFRIPFISDFIDTLIGFISSLLR